MDRQSFLKWLQSANPIILDGATGTNLQAAGMPSGVSPERWVLENPLVLQQLQRDFYHAGSDIVYAFTFGANRCKLSHHGIPDADVASWNTRLALLSCQVRDEIAPGRTRQPLVAGDLAPTGEFLAPAGHLEFEELVDIYREQVRGMLKAGVDLFVAETMLDLAQTRAAVMAVHDVCDLPVLASLTVEKNGRTLSGNSIHECVLSLASCGADAIGLNCSFGPEGLGQLVQQVLATSPVPLLVKPNAGLPHLIDGHTVFDMQPDHFARSMTALAKAGVQLVGGCCGTRPDHIKALTAQLAQEGVWTTHLAKRDGLILAEQQSAIQETFAKMICSSRRSLDWREVCTWPTLSITQPDDLSDACADAAEEDPLIICLDTATWGSHTSAEWCNALDDVQITFPIPLIFKGENRELINALIRRYHGRAGLITRSLTDLTNVAILIEA
ncbi:MAG: homocysteine S-methyltransferase family protein [Eubacteriales bacterium]|nr:homocysteine S-methyltransferase family protein [Eubacteriales bacterium]